VDLNYIKQDIQSINHQLLQEFFGGRYYSENIFLETYFLLEGGSIIEYNSSGGIMIVLT